MQPNYDVIILGAGALGSAAAYYLAARGQRVLVLEQFEINHQKGSSYGASRIIRYAYDLPVYIELMKVAYPLWSQIESESGEQLYTKTGGIDFGPSGQPLMSAIQNALAETNIPFQTMTGADARHEYPQFQFEDDWTVLYQADAGILSASKSVLAHVDLAKRHGAEFCSKTPVRRIHAYADHVAIETDNEVFSAGQLVIAAGSWMQTVLKQLDIDVPLHPMRCQESYYVTRNPEQYEPDRFPTFIAHIKEGLGFWPYGMGSMVDSGLKIGLHGGDLVNHPSEIDYGVDQITVNKVLQFTKQVLPDVVELRSARICLYTMTPDEHFLIDRHPGYANIVMAGGCSGHAFKFSTLIGKILADLTLDGNTPHDLSLFSLKRFL
jgi:sarcosine oxidase